jgi:hypothetical protein
VTIVIAEQLDQIALFQKDPDEDVGGGDGRKQQMSDRHERRRPEGDDEAEIDRMTHELVVERRAKHRRRWLLVRQILHHLLHAEQLEMVDQERAGEDEDPSEQGKPCHGHGQLWITDLPDDRRHRAPLPE